MELHQLTPQDRLVDPQELLSELDLAARAHDNRPYTIANFVSSADGHATFQGRSGGLGDEVDRKIFHGLRDHVDAVLAGTVTVRVERYGRLIGDPQRRERRRAAGRSPEPLMCIVTRSGMVPTQAPVFSEPEARIVVFGPPGTEVEGFAAQVELVALDPGEMTLTTAMRRLHADFKVASLLCEGGPTLFGELLQEGIVDELFLTLAPKLTGGGASPAITSGAELPRLQMLELLWALEHAGSLYLRYGVAPPT